MNGIVSRGRELAANTYRQLQTAAVTAVTPAPAGQKVTTWGNGYFTVNYAPATKSLDFEALVEKNTYLAIAFGTKMTKLDAITI